MRPSRLPSAASGRPGRHVGPNARSGQGSVDGSKMSWSGGIVEREHALASAIHREQAGCIKAQNQRPQVLKRRLRHKSSASPAAPGDHSDAQWLELIRGHWGGVEVRNHWRRDALLGEDGSRSRKAVLSASLVEFVRSCRDVLTGTCRGELRKLIDFGFDVDDTPKAKKPADAVKKAA